MIELRWYNLIGLMGLISFTFVTVTTWILAEVTSIPFLIGEPNHEILYIEWGLGLIGLVGGIDLLRRDFIYN